ncbi:hypothetical protein [Capybara microvirus Cap1_SP_163]|nr:hypothetical protein [Capybara microvirus Cap1_SP_163]
MDILGRISLACLFVLVLLTGIFLIMRGCSHNPHNRHYTKSLSQTGVGVSSCVRSECAYRAGRPRDARASEGHASRVLARVARNINISTRI